MTSAQAAVLSSDPNACGPKDLIAPAVSALHLVHDLSRLMRIARHGGDGFVQLGIESLAQAVERLYSLCFEQA